jgi:MFS family permease
LLTCTACFRHIPPAEEALADLSVQRTEGSPSIWKDQVFWFVIALGIGYGAIYNFLPATFPVFSRYFGCTLAQLGQLQFLFFLASLAFSVIGGPLIARLGLKRAAMFAFTVAIIALLLIVQASQFSALRIGAALFGFSISAMVVISGSIVSRHFGDRRQSVFLITGLSDAGGSMIGPAMLGWWIANSGRWNMSWKGGYFIAVADMVVLFAWAIIVRSASLGREKATDEKPVSDSHLGQILISSSLYVAVILGFCHGLAQAGMLSFIGQLYIKKLQIDAARAAYFISLNAAGVLGGRFLFGWITARRKIPELLMISICAAAETAAFFGAIAGSTYLAGVLMFITAGVFVSTIGPSLNSYIGGRFAQGTATAFALFAGLSNLGAASGPFIIGLIGTKFGVAHGILFAPCFSLLLSLLALIRFFWERRGQKQAGMTTSTSAV